LHVILHVKVYFICATLKHRLIMLHKIQNKQVNVDHSHLTTTRNNKFLIPHKTKHHMNSFYPRAIWLWNGVPNEIKDAPTVPAFASGLLAKLSQWLNRPICPTSGQHIITCFSKTYVEGRVPSPRTGADTFKSKSTGITINIYVCPQGRLCSPHRLTCYTGSNT